VTDNGVFAGTQPIARSRAAAGAVLFFSLMVILFVVVPNQFITSDPSQFTKIVTVAYVVVLFGVVAWIVAAWQNKGQAVPQPVSHKVSSFGRPMREGPGFASFADKIAPKPESQRVHARSVDTEPPDNTSSFGRPLKKRSQ
jgi:hypothetical protein